MSGLPCRAPDIIGIRCDDDRGRRRFFAPVAGNDVDALRAAAAERDRHELDEHGLRYEPPPAPQARPYAHEHDVHVRGGQARWASRARKSASG
jgi:hypothetical protein